MHEKELKRYLKDIKGCLLCGTKQTKRFLDDLSESIDAYIVENNVTEFRAVEEHFGTPEQIAKSFFAEADIGYIRKKMRIRRIITICMIVALAAWCIMVGISVVDNHKSANGHGVEKIFYTTDDEMITEPNEIIIQGDSA